MITASQISFSSRFTGILFIISKILRFIFFLLFLVLLSSKTKLIVGYSLWQIIFFFLTFNLIDSIAQFFLREVYRFSWRINSGNFDYTLTKPFSPLFRSLFGGGDVLDLPTIFILIIFMIFALSKIGPLTIFGIVIYALLVLNAFLIAISLHIFVLGLGVLTTQIDNAVLLYRDLTQMVRIPVDIYKQPFRSLLTFVIPVGIMITFPVKALIGMLSIDLIIISFLTGGAIFFLSLKFWQFSLRYYSSASS